MFANLNKIGILGHQKIINFLKTSVEKNRISHAYLFSGDRGSGKFQAALFFAKLILSLPPHQKTFTVDQDKNNDDKSKRDYLKIIPIKTWCGGEENLENNPDFKLIDAKENIGIGEIRDLIRFLSFKACENFKIAVVNNAELMTQEAESAFLKTLEEPNGKAVIILITALAGKLKETILSRLIRINFRPVPGEILEDKEKKIKEFEKILNSSLFDKFDYVGKKCENREDLADFFENCRIYFRKKMIKEASEKKNEEALKAVNFLKSVNETEEILKYNVSPKLALEVLMTKIYV